MFFYFQIDLNFLEDKKKYLKLLIYILICFGKNISATTNFTAEPFALLVLIKLSIRSSTIRYY